MAATDDRYLIWPTLAALGVPALHIAIRATPAGSNFVYVVLVMPALAMIWGGIGAAGFVMASYNFAANARKRALSWLSVCLIVGTGMLELDTVRRYTNLAGDVLHFAVMYPSYIAEIKKLPANGEPKLIVFNFGGMIWASGGVVYDESGEIEKPPADQSAAWKLRAETNELGCGGYSYTPLIRHFYLASFPC